MAFLAITGFFCFRAAAFTSGADFCAIWKAGSLLPLRFCVGPSLFESSAKVEAAHVFLLGGKSPHFDLVGS